MEKAGCQILIHYRQMAYMGFFEVLRNLGNVRTNITRVQQALLTHRPDVLMLVDYPSFNLRIAAFCRKHLPETKIIYYIPPKVWAWKSWRIHRICRLCDEVWGIFPFETEYYKERGYTCAYVGNPTLAEIDEWATQYRPSSAAKSGIAILPGSRRSEISHCLPRMLQAARTVGRDIVVTAAPGVEDEFYHPYLKEGEILTRETWRAVAQAEVAIVNSGTATLETALIGTPQVAVYHIGWSALLGPLRPRFQRYVFPLGYFTLVNIIAKRQVIRELLADEFTVPNVAHELQLLLTDSAYQERMKEDYRHIREILQNKQL